MLQQLFPEIEFAPRPVLLHIYLPESFNGVLFIENQDTYIQALAGRPAEVEGLRWFTVRALRVVQGVSGPAKVPSCTTREDPLGAVRRILKRGGLISDLRVASVVLG